MLNGQRVIAVIPARKGSKRIVDKNVRLLAGKPLISWTIEAAKRSQYIDKILVSSDCKIVHALTEDLGVAYDYRKVDLASDTAESIDVVLDIISRNYSFDVLILLQPTSPLRNEKHIDEALELATKSNEDMSVVSVSEIGFRPEWTNKLDESGTLQYFISNLQEGVRSQDLQKYYQINGAIYVKKIDALLEKKEFISPNTKAYIMDRLYSVDIDEEFDFRLCEFLKSNPI